VDGRTLGHHRAGSAMTCTAAPNPTMGLLGLVSCTCRGLEYEQLSPDMVDLVPVRGLTAATPGRQFRLFFLLKAQPRVYAGTVITRSRDDKRSISIGYRRRRKVDLRPSNFLSARHQIKGRRGRCAYQQWCRPAGIPATKGRTPTGGGFIALRPLADVAGAYELCPWLITSLTSPLISAAGRSE